MTPPLPCGSGPSCTITVNPGDASFTIWSYYKWFTAEEPYNEHLAASQYWVVVDAVPFTATISGPQYLYPSTVCTWWGGGNSGNPPYTYSWSGRLSGTSNSVTGGFSRSGDLFLTVTDSRGRVASAQFYIETGSGYSTSCQRPGLY